jgi:gamma-polyglutamate biosynthesis protein CapA
MKLENQIARKVFYATVGFAAIFLLANAGAVFLRTDRIWNLDFFSAAASPAPDKNYDASETPAVLEKQIFILSFGDMMLGRDVGKALAKNNDLFEKIRGADGIFLKSADFVSANLEGPITDIKSCQEKEFTFKFSPDVAGMLAKNNFNIVNLANNHIFDCGRQGLADTKKYLDAAGVSHFGGLDDIAIKKVNDQTVAFMGINATSIVDIEKFAELAAKLKSENNYVVVNIHWGIEYGKNPSKSQTEIAHKLIDSGADLIIGHHPHVIEPLEIYKNKPIFYSLGNFVFDQVFPGTNDGLGVEAILSKNKIDLRLFPFKIKKFQPELLYSSDSEKFCADFLKGVSQKDVCEVEIKSK